MRHFCGIFVHINHIYLHVAFRQLMLFSILLAFQVSSIDLSAGPSVWTKNTIPCTRSSQLQCGRCYALGFKVNKHDRHSKWGRCSIGISNTKTLIDFDNPLELKRHGYELSVYKCYKVALQRQQVFEVNVLHGRRYSYLNSIWKKLSVIGYFWTAACEESQWKLSTAHGNMDTTSTSLQNYMSSQSEGWKGLKY